MGGTLAYATIPAAAAPARSHAAKTPNVFIHTFNYNDNAGATPPCGGPPFSGADTMGGNYSLIAPGISGGGCFSGTLDVSRNGRHATTTETLSFGALGSVTIKARGKLSYSVPIEPGLAAVDGHWRVIDATGEFGFRARGTWTGVFDLTPANPFPVGPPPFFAFDFTGSQRGTQ
jgi:hypothetical protein